MKKILPILIFFVILITLVSYGFDFMSDKRAEKYLAYNNDDFVISSDVVVVISPIDQDENIRAKVRNAAKASGKTEEAIYGLIDNEVAKLSSEMTKHGVTIVDRTQNDKILDEMRWQMSAWASETNLASIGKAFNANYILIVDPVFNKIYYDSIIHLNGTFLNVETMEKKSFSSYNYSDWDYSLLSSASRIEGQWLYDGVMVSSANYSSNTMKWVTPFSNGYKLTKADKKISDVYALGDLRFLIISSKDAEASYYNSNIKKCILSFSGTKDEIEERGGKRLRTYKIGMLSIKDEQTGKTLVSGDAFIMGNTLYVLEGFTKGGKGKAIFHMFSK